MNRWKSLLLREWRAKLAALLAATLLWLAIRQAKHAPPAAPAPAARLTPGF